MLAAASWMTMTPRSVRVPVRGAWTTPLMSQGLLLRASRFDAKSHLGAPNDDVAICLRCSSLFFPPSSLVIIPSFPTPGTPQEVSHLNKGPCVLQKPLSCFFLRKQAPTCVSAFHANVFSFGKSLLGRHVRVPGLRPQEHPACPACIPPDRLWGDAFVLGMRAEATPVHPPTPPHLKRQRSENPRNHDASPRGPLQVEILYVRFAPARRT